MNSEGSKTAFFSSPRVSNWLCRFLFLLLMMLLLAACSQSEQLAQSATEVVESQPESNVQVTAEPSTPTTLPELTEDASEEIEQPTPTAEPPTSQPTEPSERQVEPIEVTYFTPAQQEGPYYTVEKPQDRDNDLTQVEGAAGPPAGQIIEFSGTVYDATGMPVPGITVEIWQTDANGIYLHPNDPDTERRDRNFQFYGEAMTDEDGLYNFRTILPGRYEPRPRHIHVKVKLNGQELLTTQFYFEEDGQLAGDGAHLIIPLAEGQEANGQPVLSGQRDIILNSILSGG